MTGDRLTDTSPHALHSVASFAIGYARGVVDGDAGARDEAVGARFALGAMVAHGAFGEVWQGVDRETGARVAIKRLAEGLSDPNAGERLELEGRLLAGVDDPHVVRCLAHGADETGRRCVVLEWLEGEDLSRRLARGPLTMGDAVRFARHTALGLAALHARGIVHRDIKPSNLFAARVPDEAAPRVKLIDLGIARAVDEPTLTMAGLRIGTPAYMSPEQALADESIGPASDLFSLGAVLYELLAGRRAFAGSDPFAILAKIVLQDPAPLTRVAPGAPPALEVLVHRAMARDPSARFVSARAMADALASLVLPEPEALAAPTLVRGTAADDAPTSQVEAPTVASTGLHSEQRIVTVVFATLADDALLDDARSRFDKAVTSEHGAPLRLRGARAVATFGLSRAVGDEPLRAARAALAIAAGDRRARLAVVTCRVAAGEGDEALPSEALELGVEELAGTPSGAVCVDEITARLLDAHFVVENVAGSYVVRGARAGDAAVHDAARRLSGRETTTVGRERELGMLDGIRAECLAESAPHAVVVTAPAGMGKSRLRYEWLARLARRNEPTTVMTGRGDPMSAGSPLGLVIRAVRAACGMSGGAPTDEHRARLKARLACVPEAERARVAEFLGELIGVPGQGEPSEALRAARRDPLVMGDQLQRAWCAWLAAECARAPVVLVLEDLHWGDGPSVRFVDTALRDLPDAALMVVATARPDVDALFPDLWRSRGVARIELGELPRRASERLVREVLGARADDATVTRLCDRAAGNAFFLEELIRAVDEGQSAEALPDTVLAMLQARLDALEPPLRRAMRAASVFGETFWQGGVAALLGEPAAALVARLCDREVAQSRAEARFPGERECVFRHALVREAAYASLLEVDRVAWHASAAAWLERVGEQDPIVIAEHYERGGEPARAVAYLRAAVTEALEANDFPAAIARAERGLADLASAGAGCDPDGRLEALFHLDLASALRWSGRFADSERSGLLAIERLARGSDAWCSAVAELTSSTQMLGKSDQLVALADSVLDVARGVHDGPDPLLFGAIARITSHLYFCERVADAQRFMAWIDRACASWPIVDPLVGMRVALARASRAVCHDVLQDALEAFDEARRYMARAGEMRGECMQQQNVGFIYLELGAYEQAETTLREAVAWAGKRSIPMVAAVARHNLGLALALAGRVDEGLEEERRAIASMTAQDISRDLAGAKVYLARILAMAGRYTEAEIEVRDAMTRLATLPQMRSDALTGLARVLLAQGRGDEALVATDEALAVFASLRLPVVPALLRVRAEVLLFHARRDEAREVIAQALAAVHERHAKIRDPALAASYANRVPDNVQIRTMARELGVGDDEA